MKQKTAVTAFKKFEIANPTKILGGTDAPPITDKKKVKTPKSAR